MMMTPGMMSAPPFNNPYSPPTPPPQFSPNCPPPGNLGMFGSQGSPQPQPNMGLPMFPQPGMFPQGMQFGNKGNHRLNVIG